MTTAQRTAHFRELTREVGVPRSLVRAYEEPARRKPTAFWLVHFGKRQADQLAKKFYYVRDALEFRNLVQKCGWKARIISGEELA